MRRTSWLTLAFCAAAAGTLAWPVDAAAQRRGSPGRSVAVPRPAVSHARPYYYGRPYYGRSYYYGRPYYYGGPYFYGYGWPYYYSSLYWGFGWGWGGWPQYPHYPYPYGYPYYWDHASLRVQVTPREAEVFVDGYFVGLVDDFDGFSQRLDIEPGEHEIQIFLPGHRSIRERMLFRPREGYKIQRAMEPLGAGEAAESRPAPTGPPPERREYGREGERVPVRAPDRQDTFGALSIRVQPADAIVIIDGERWDRPQGENRLVVDLAEGPHKIEVQREGHQPYSTTVQVRRGEVTTLNVSLPR